MTPIRRLGLAAFATALAACNGSSGPPPPAPTFSLTALVYYDKSANGERDTNDSGVVPGAEVTIGGRSGSAAPGTGLAVVTGVPGGVRRIEIPADALPPFYVPGAAREIGVPVAEGQVVGLAATLPIGNNVPTRYMAFGDSITDGDGAFDNQGYRPLLQAALRSHFGEGSIVNEAIGGTRSNEGADRITSSLRRTIPAYALILYGTNDWNDSACRNDFPCFTIDSLREMVRAAKARSTLSVLSTIIPVPEGLFGPRTPPSRNVWVAQMNDLIRVMAAEEGALVVDSYAAFVATPDYKALFADHVHPNDAGYAILEQAFFDALTTVPASQ